MVFLKRFLDDSDAVKSHLVQRLPCGNPGLLSILPS